MKYTLKVITDNKDDREFSCDDYDRVLNLFHDTVINNISMINIDEIKLVRNQDNKVIYLLTKSLGA